MEVARRFDPKRVKFVMLGHVVLDPDKIRPYQDHVQLVGSVPRSKVKDWLGKFDVFLFPSTCEGSAGAVMEAMAAGLPVCVTPNSGSVARHGIDGFIHRYDEIDQFTNAIQQLDDDRDMLQKMGDSARQRAIGYDLPAYGADLLRFFEGLLLPPVSNLTGGRIAF
jgi:glycosyltransferase involved in cell wall biosynthesis